MTNYDELWISLFEASQSLFWASFGLIDLGNFELSGVKSYTRFWGMMMFGSYSVINVVVLLNLLIAMMSNSYSLITEHSDCEWKFARSKLWMSYFEPGSTLPPPFNLLSVPKSLMTLAGLRTSSAKGLHRVSTKVCRTFALSINNCKSTCGPCSDARATSEIATIATLL